MAGSSLRFVIMGDDRASAAFNRFSRSIERANGSVDRNRTAMAKHDVASQSMERHLLGAVAALTGFDSAVTMASRGSGRFTKVVAGLNLATGVLEPAMAGLVVTIGSVVSATTAAAVGLGSVALVMGPIASQVKNISQLESQAAKGSKVAQKQLQDTLKQTPPVVRQFAHSLDQAGKTYRAWSFSLARPVLAPFTRALQLVRPILNALAPAVRAGAGAIGSLVDEMGAAVKGGGFARWVKAISPSIGPIITQLGEAIGHIVVGLGGITRVFAPMAVRFTAWLERITRKFAEWGQTLGSHSGFKSLMTMFRTETPLAMGILKNLGTVISNILKTMAGMTNPANSRALLLMLSPISQLLAMLSKNQGLMQFLLWLMLIRSSLGRLTPLFRGATFGLRLMRGGWEGVNMAMKANLIGIIVTGLSLLVAGVIYAWKHFGWFRDIVRATWGWIKDHWPLLFGIITGGLGPAVIWIIKNWGRITKSFKDALNSIKKVAQLVWDYIKLGALTAIDWILKGFSHIPFIGHFFASAEKQVAKWIRNIQKDIDRLNGKTVNINADFHAAAVKAGNTGLTVHGRGTGQYGATGGLVRGPGGPRDDKAGLFWLSNREYIMQAAAVSRYGVPFMEALNAGRLAGGGTPGRADIITRFHLTPIKTAAAALTTALVASADQVAKKLYDSLSRLFAPAGTTAVGSLPANWRAIVSFLMANGYTPMAAAGIAGNIYRESGGNPEAVGTGGGGLIGWTPMSKARPIQPIITGNVGRDLQAQLIDILTYNRGWGQYLGMLNRARTPSEAAWIYMTYFERPGIPALGVRQASANAVARAMGLRFARGGVITEPVAGVGLRSGASYTFGEAGREYVAGTDLAKIMRQVVQKLDQLIAAVDAVGPVTGQHVAGAIGGAARAATYSALYSPQ